MKPWLANLLMAVIVVCAVFMIVSFFVNFPKWLTIGGTALLIAAIACLVAFDKDKNK